MNIQKWLLGFSIFLLGSCQVQKEEASAQNSDAGIVDNQSSSEQNKVLSQYSELGNNFKVSLTDAPNKELSKVYVNIKEVLLKVGGSGSKRAEVKIAQNIGIVDLLTLQNGVMMEMADVNLPIGLKVNQIRLVLEDFGNSIEYANGSTCDLQTPSQQKTGLKLISPEFSIEEGKGYSLVVDFDAKKSIVHQGNGGCLLKPVLKWGGITSIDLDDDSGSDDEEVITNPGDDGSDEEGSDDEEGSEENSDENSEESSEEESESDDSEQGNGSDGLADCFAVDFDLYDIETWPDDFVFEEYEHCY
jgi:hypothetical protein